MQPNNTHPSSTVNRKYLYFTVFIGGMSTLAIEFTTSRMLQTVYGTSNLVWANVIGLVLLFLTAGYFIGGWLADKRPFPTTFYTLVVIAGFASVFFLLLTSLVLRTAAAAMATINVNALAGSLVIVVLALGVPVILLGCISPFAVRLAVQDVGQAGRVSGRIYAISTWGSILGTYLPVLLTIPLLGSRLTAVLFGSLLLLTGLIGLWEADRRRGQMGALAALLLIPIILLWTRGNLKAYEGQLFEAESSYNYIQVIRQDDCNYLLLNEGQAYHSFYCDDGRVPVVSVWSIMLAAPYFNADPPELQRVAVIGLAAGTIPKQLTRVFGPVPMDGIEIDPVIVQVGRDYFAMTEPNLNAIVGDGRYEFNRLDQQYSLVTIDAYKVPYIPWHLTTREFFQEVQASLTADGVVAINVGRAPQDRSLIDAMSNTLLAVFPTVHALDVPGTLNTILIATNQPTTPDNVARHLTTLSPEADPLLRAALETAVTHQVPVTPSDILFTDERAPVETIVDTLVLRYLLQEVPVGLPALGP
jgi:spermidine synthase